MSRFKTCAVTRVIADRPQNCIQPLQQVILEDTKTVDPGQDCAQRKTERWQML